MKKTLALLLAVLMMLTMSIALADEADDYYLEI